MGEDVTGWRIGECVIWNWSEEKKQEVIGCFQHIARFKRVFSDTISASLDELEDDGDLRIKSVTINPDDKIMVKATELICEMIKEKHAALDGATCRFSEKRALS